MQINKLNTFVNEWNFDKMSFMVDLRIDNRTLFILFNLVDEFGSYIFFFNGLNNNFTR